MRKIKYNIRKNAIITIPWYKATENDYIICQDQNNDLSKNFLILKDDKDCPDVEVCKLTGLRVESNLTDGEYFNWGDGAWEKDGEDYIIVDEKNLRKVEIKNGLKFDIKVL